MERYKCKLCTRSFITGRALGGHMKAHLATLPYHHLTPPSSSPLFSFSSSSENSDVKSLIDSHSPLSSISETSPEEELAKTLMMLSRDKWKINVVVKQESQSQEIERSMEEMEFRKNSRKHKCDKCGQNFRSSTAMKSHRNICLQIEAATTSGGDHKIFKCLVCSKVFGSGQALGGHKKSHLHKKKLCFIDLNLPPSLQENDDSEQCVFYE